MVKIVVYENCSCDIGYVGLSNAVLFAENHEVVAFDLDPEKMEMVNNKVSPMNDPEMQDYLLSKSFNLKATLDKHVA